MIGSSNPALDEAIRASALDARIREAERAGEIFTARRLREERAKLSPPREDWLMNDLSLTMDVRQPADLLSQLRRLSR